MALPVGSAERQLPLFGWRQGSAEAVHGKRQRRDCHPPRPRHSDCVHAAQDGTHRESVDIVADSVQFLGAPDANANRNGAADPVAAGAVDEDDIPF